MASLSRVTSGFNRASWNSAIEQFYSDDAVASTHLASAPKGFPLYDSIAMASYDLTYATANKESLSKLSKSDQAVAVKHIKSQMLSAHIRNPYR